ncbi:hypothetical protein F8388_004710 [Cannabis sativa]|uniref:CCHC-type domain-containing protein n=1 Tax=Cannabis sativa TaxID=3483 RepID=A0A7J6HNA8_CANSA|nr:hypothetical protein F8388_004710 [Cannabis sativa]
MDELLQKTHNLQVTDEDEEWEVDKMLGGIWRLKDVEWNLKIKEKFDSGLFLTFTFASESIQSRVLSKMPWYLSNEVLILGKMENSNESWKHDLTSFPIWGRAYGVPIDLLTINNIVRMVAKAGEPVCLGFPLPCSGKKKWIAFKYDELPFMCFKCGRIGHSHKDCHQDPITISEDGNEVTDAYGIWLKVDNGPAIGLEKTPTPATALSSLGDTRIGVTNMRDESKAKQDHLKQSIEGGSISLPRMSGMQSGDIEIGENQIRSDDGSRGKRRIVEDYGDSGYGKLKKSTTVLSKEFQEHDLFNIPISYSQEAQVLEGSTTFAVGSGSKDLAKENRRKNPKLIKFVRKVCGSSWGLLGALRWKLVGKDGGRAMVAFYWLL